MVKFPTEWKNKIHVPNHQPDMMFGGYSPENSQETCTVHELSQCFS
jgi:hypothetical protein